MSNRSEQLSVPSTLHLSPELVTEPAKPVCPEPVRVRFMETESGMAVARGWGGVFNGYEILVGGGEKFQR